jgi:DNA-binding NarL/FixJ family response regulator
VAKLKRELIFAPLATVDGVVMTHESVRTVVCDDNELVVLGLVNLLKNAGFDIVGTAGDGEAAIEIIGRVKPTLVIMDLMMPKIDGIQATHLIKQKWPDVKVLVITSSSDEKMVNAALASGADGYCVKDSSAQQTITAANALVQGGMWLDREIARMVLANTSLEGGAPSPVTSSKPSTGGALGRAAYKLSQREHEVLTLLTQGLQNHEISKRLGVGSETIKTHMRHIMEKLMVADRTQAAVKAIREGIVPVDTRQVHREVP